MSRCTACNIELQGYISYNKNTRQEEDLCSNCKNISTYPANLRTHTYQFEYERQGVKLMPPDYYDNY